jgi:hypothetical protein
LEKFQYLHFSKFPKLSKVSIRLIILENLGKSKNFLVLLKNLPNEKFQYFGHFSKFPKTFKNSLNVSVRLIILENLGKF